MLNLRHTRHSSFVRALPSATAGFTLQAHFEVRWKPRVGRRRQRLPENALQVLVTTTATERVAEMPADRLDTAQDAILAALGRLTRLAQHDVEVLSATVTIEIPEDQQHQLHAYNEQRRQEELADHLQRLTLARVAQFRSTVLADPASAMAYWFMMHPEDVDPSTYHKIEQLHCTIAQLDRSSGWFRAAKILEDFVHELKPPEKAAVVQLLADVLAKFGHPDEAQELRATVSPSAYTAEKYYRTGSSGLDMQPASDQPI